jgi:DNA mismatch repair protein PMS2
VVPDISFPAPPPFFAASNIPGRLNQEPQESTTIEVKGLISKFAIGCGRTNLERQFFYVNGRPCALPKVQKAFNEVYRTFNMNQSPFIVANFIIPTGMFPSLPHVLR